MSKASPLIIEFLGTFFLCLTIGLTPLDGFLAPLVVGSHLMIWVFAGGYLSGAQYNIAVTLGVFFSGRRKMTFSDVIGYIVVQLLGGFCGSLVAHYLTRETIAFAPGDGFDSGRAFVAEMVYTFALVTMVLNTATTQANDGNMFFGLCIGFAVFTGGASVGHISNGCFNPAVGIAHSLVHNFYDDGTLEYLWLYILAPILGGLLASVAFRVTNPEEYEPDNKETYRSLDRVS